MPKTITPAMIKARKAQLKSRYSLVIYDDGSWVIWPSSFRVACKGHNATTDEVPAKFIA